MTYTDIRSIPSPYPAEENYPVQKAPSSSGPVYLFIGQSGNSIFHSEAGTRIFNAGEYDPSVAFAYGHSYAGVTPPPVTYIHSFPNELYDILKPIPVHFEEAQPFDESELSGVIASFEDGNIAIVGETWEEAFKGIQAEILDTLEDYEKDESILGPEPKRQLAVLKEHIAHKNKC